MPAQDYPLDDIRSRFPALSLDRDIGGRIYLDNPAGTQVPETVVERMSRCLFDANANLGGAFESSRRAGEIVADAHQAMADFLNAPSPDEIVFGQNMTSLTFHLSRSIGRALSAGDEVIVTRMDHDANVWPWVMMARDHGLEVKWLPFDPASGEFELARLDELLTERTRLVCVGGASNLIGTLNDVAAISARARAAGAWTFVDAVQSAPHVPTDVQALGCDFLVCSAYKFFGPHQGILWGRREILESLEPYKVRPAPDRLPGRFETGTQSHEGMAGVEAAVDYFAALGEEYAAHYADRFPAMNGRTLHIHAALAWLFDYEEGLTRHLVDGLQSLPGVRVHGITDPAHFSRRVPTVAFSLRDVAPAMIARELGQRRIFVWSGHNYALEAVRSLGLMEAGGVIRVGPVHYNSTDEIDVLLSTLESLLPRIAPAVAGGR
jgi:cysteine desulfurase family protein (TIGR01976 family)